MGNRKRRRNNGGGNKTHKNHQNKQNNPFGGQHSNQMELASKFPPRTNATGNCDDDRGNEILEEVVAQAMIQFVMGGGELDEESFLNFFWENFLGILLAKLSENEHCHIGRPNADDGFDTSSDDDGVDFRFSNPYDEAPFFKQKRQNGRSKRKHKKGRLNDPAAIEVFIKMLIIQCILEDQRRRRNKRFFWKVGSVFFLIAFIIYYWWY